MVRRRLRHRERPGRRQIVAMAIGAWLTGCGPAAPDRPGTLTPIDPPALAGAMAPQIATSGDDLWLSWLEPGVQGGHRLRAAPLREAAWGPAITVAEADDMLANWADVPSLIMLPGGELAAHWLRLGAGGGENYGIRITASPDGGRSWSELGSPHRDPGPGEHGFVSAVVESSAARLFWLDGRELAARPEGGVSESGAPKGGGMQLRTVTLTAAAIGPEEVIDPDVCTCCPTSAVIGAGGPVVFYRDHTDGEIRDIAAIHRVGAGWSDPVLVHADGWEVPGCPVNGPAAAAGPEGRTLVVAWFTAADNQPRVRAAFSQDGGATFGEALEIDADRPHGRTAVLMHGDHEAIVVWMSASGADGAELRLRRIDTAGRMSGVVPLARVKPGRSSGFPRLARAGGEILVAWTDAATPSRVRAALLREEAVPAVR